MLQSKSERFEFGFENKRLTFKNTPTHTICNAVLWYVHSFSKSTCELENIHYEETKWGPYNMFCKRLAVGPRSSTAANEKENQLLKKRKRNVGKWSEPRHSPGVVLSEHFECSIDIFIAKNRCGPWGDSQLLPPCKTVYYCACRPSHPFLFSVTLSGFGFHWLLLFVSHVNQNCITADYSPMCLSESLLL